ncbi:MAG: hypothetical protein WD008_02020, partial [Balneolaceae bacterium]
FLKGKDFTVLPFLINGGKFRSISHSVVKVNAYRALPCVDTDAPQGYKNPRLFTKQLSSAKAPFRLPPNQLSMT